MPHSDLSYRPSANSRQEAAAILRLAGPMIVAQVAQTGIAFVDTVIDRKSVV